MLTLESFTKKEAMEFVERNLNILDGSQDEEMKSLAEEYRKVALSADSAEGANTEIVFRILELMIKKLELTIKELEGTKALEMLDMITYFAQNDVSKNYTPKNDAAENDILANTFLPKLAGDNKEELLLIKDTLEQHGIIELKQGRLSINGLVQKIRRAQLEESSLGEETLKEVLSSIEKHGIEKCTPQEIAAWEHASKYNNLIEKFIVDSVKQRNINYFHLIVRDCSYEVVEKIINSIQDPKKLRALMTVSDENKKTVLHYAAEGGNKETVELLLKKKANINSETRYDYRPIHFAAQGGHNDVVEILLKQKGVEIDAQTKYKNTALHLAVRNKHTAVVETLLRNNANVNIQDNKGFTALHWAVLDNNVDIIDKLLERKEINLNLQTTDGNTVLHLAAKSNNSSIVRKLIKKGADATIENKEGKVALDYIKDTEENKDIRERLSAMSTGTSTVMSKVTGVSKVTGTREIR